MSGFATYVPGPIARSNGPYCDFNSHVRDSSARRAVGRDPQRACIRGGHAEATTRGCKRVLRRRHAVADERQRGRARARRHRRAVDVADDVEITLEANPNAWSRPLSRYRAAASIGFRSACKRSMNPRSSARPPARVKEARRAVRLRKASSRAAASISARPPKPDASRWKRS